MVFARAVVQTRAMNPDDGAVMSKGMFAGSRQNDPAMVRPRGMGGSRQTSSMRSNARGSGSREEYSMRSSAMGGARQNLPMRSGGVAGFSGNYPMRRRSMRRENERPGRRGLNFSGWSVRISQGDPWRLRFSHC
jgi:hypothetical protein